MPFDIDFSPKSTLGALTVFGFIVWIGGMFLKSVNENIGSQIENAGFLVFIICFVIWLVFVFMSIARNLDEIVSRF